MTTKTLNRFITLSFAIAVSWASSLNAAEKTTSANPGNSAAKENKEGEAAYTQSIEKRVADILAALELKDSEKKSKLRGLLIAHYRSLRDWHDANDPRLKTASESQAKEIKSSLKVIHEKFIGGLSAEVSPEQVEKIKDKMTYGTVKVTHDAYCEIVPNLTEPEKEKILELLKEGREEAMDGGSHQEKTAIFKRYKGKINNYLDGQGHNVKQAYKDWGEKQKAKAGANSSDTDKKD